MRKKELEKIWKQLDGACEAIEKLENEEIDVLNKYRIDLSAIANLKSDIEEMIESKSRK